jgi:hypothetical protein
MDFKKPRELDSFDKSSIFFLMSMRSKNGMVNAKKRKKNNFGGFLDVFDVRSRLWLVHENMLKTKLTHSQTP